MEFWKNNRGFVAMWIPVTLCVAFLWLLDGLLWGNETQRIPIVKHFLDPTWIPNDWFLNTPMIYQIPFNLVVAPFVAFLDADTATVLLRFILYAWIASGIVALARKLEIGLVPLLPAVAAAVVIRYLAAGEWMVGHAEAKVVAYGAVLWAFSFLISNRYQGAAALLGLATTFHVLVGLYAVLTSLLFLLAHPRHRRVFIKALPTSIALFLIAGGFGIFMIAQNLASKGGVDSFTDLIYIARNPDHVWPPVWSNHVHLYVPAWVDRYAWVAKAVLSLSFLALIAVRSRSRSFREFALLALSSTPLFVIGMLIYAYGPIGLLKYLPFRFPDVLLPFAAFLLFFGTWERVAIGSSNLCFGYPVRRILRIGLITAAGLTVLGGIQKLTSDLQIKRTAGVPWAFVHLSPEERDATRWIRANAPADALFLSDPWFAPFYLTAERGVLVSYRHFPQNEKDVREWHDRLAAINGGRGILLDPPQIARKEIQDSFNSLPLRDARNLAKQYGLDYYHGPFREDWAIAPIYRAGSIAVYRLR